RETRLRLGVVRRLLENAAEDGRRGLPLGERNAVAAELHELRRARNSRREQPRDFGELLRRYDATEVVQAMEPERLADRVRSLESELVGKRFGRESDAVLFLEQRTEAAADGLVLRPGKLHAVVLQRREELARAQREAAVADAMPVVVPEPLG